MSSGNDLTSVSLEQVLVNYGTLPVAIISIEGTVGCGKSTALQQIAANPAQMLTRLLGETRLARLNAAAVLVTLEEPLEAYKNCGPTNLLGEFYRDQKAHAFLFEIHVLRCRAQAMKQLIVDTVRQHAATHGNALPVQIVVVQERSLYSCRYVFARMLRDQGLLSDAEWINYCDVYDFYQRTWHTDFAELAPLVRNVAVQHLATIYFKFEPRAALERIVARNRDGEVIDGVSSIPLEYLQRLQTQHDSTFNPYDVKWRSLFHLHVLTPEESARYFDVVKQE